MPHHERDMNNDKSLQLAPNSFDDYFSRRVKEFLGHDWPFNDSPSALTRTSDNTSSDNHTSSDNPSSDGTSSVLTNPRAFKMDVNETPTHFEVYAELPGVPKENVQVHCEGRLLTIEATRSNHCKKDTDTSHLVERSYGQISRSITMPQSVDMDRSEARVENGVLTIRFQKTKPSNPPDRKKIAIN